MIKTGGQTQFCLHKGQSPAWRQIQTAILNSEEWTVPLDKNHVLHCPHHHATFLEAGKKKPPRYLQAILYNILLNFFFFTFSYLRTRIKHNYKYNNYFIEYNANILLLSTAILCSGYALINTKSVPSLSPKTHTYTLVIF